jgi:hypothetical protein
MPACPLTGHCRREFLRQGRDGPRLCGKDSVSTLISARRRFCDQGAPICAVSSPNRPRCALRHTAGVDFVRRSWPKPLPRPPAARPRR